jgi:hypothetical protein
MPGFRVGIDQVWMLLEFSTSADRDCTETRAIAQQHLGQLRHKLSELRTGLQRTGIAVQLAGAITHHAVLVDERERHPQAASSSVSRYSLTERRVAAIASQSTSSDPSAERCLSGWRRPQSHRCRQALPPRSAARASAGVGPKRLLFGLDTSVSGVHGEMLHLG